MINGLYSMLKNFFMWQKYITIKWSSLFPGPWFVGVELLLWRLLLTADACSAGERGLQEPAVRTPRGPTRKQFHFYAGSQSGRLTSGGAGGHPGSATTLPLRHLPSLRTTGWMLRKERREISGRMWQHCSRSFQQFLSLIQDQIFREMSKWLKKRGFLSKIWSWFWQQSASTVLWN